MQNPFSWLFRQVFGAKRGPAVQADVNSIINPVAVAVLNANGLPTTPDGAKAALAGSVAGKINLNYPQLVAIQQIVNAQKG